MKKAFIILCQYNAVNGQAFYPLSTEEEHEKNGVSGRAVYCLGDNARTFETKEEADAVADTLPAITFCYWNMHDQTDEGNETSATWPDGRIKRFSATKTLALVVEARIPE